MTQFILHYPSIQNRGPRKPPISLSNSSLNPFLSLFLLLLSHTLTLSPSSHTHSLTSHTLSHALLLLLNLLLFCTLCSCSAPYIIYFRDSLASMHSVAWGTHIRRSRGMSLPVVLQMPYVLFCMRTRAISRLRINFT